MFTHRQLTRTLTSALAVALFAATTVIPTEAGGLKQNYPIPSPGPSHADGGVDGCWYTNQNLSGGYRLSFCLNSYHGGSYRVTGHGLDCRGGLDWNKNWLGGTQVALQQTSCGHGLDWSADSFSCYSASDWNAYANKKPQINMPIPSGGGLSCNYVPVTWGTPWSTFQASRV